MYLLNNYGNEVGPPGIEFQNNGSSSVPPYGIVRVTGTTILANREIITVDQPNAYGSQYLHYVNGAATVPAGKYGVCHNGFPIPAAFTISDGTPAFGQMWGPQSGGWTLRKNTGGFRVVGIPDMTNGIASVQREPFLTFRGTANADIASHMLGTCSIYYQSALGTYTDTTVDTGSNTVYNSLDQTVKSGSFVEVEVAYFNGTEGYRIVQSDFSC